MTYFDRCPESLTFNELVEHIAAENQAIKRTKNVLLQMAIERCVHPYEQELNRRIAADMYERLNA